VRSEGGDATEKLALLLDHARNRYVIGFTPAAVTTGDRFHKLKLQLTPEAQKRAGEISILTAQGYYVRQPDQNGAKDAGNPGDKSSAKNPD